MTAYEDSINALREALKISPDNAPLRAHLGDLLSGAGRYDEAEKEYSTALALSPGNVAVMASLAQVFYHQGKYTQALVVVEDLVKHANAPARALVLYARLLLNDGQIEKARAQYERAVETDASLKDESLAERLGHSASIRQSLTADGKVKAAPASDDDDDEFFDVDVEKSTSTFKDVGGMDEVKEQIKMKIIYPLMHAEMFKQYGKKIGGGILMYGPPGCGKTHLARATAGEIKANFVHVGISDVLDMWLGESERNLHNIFESARRNNPCVLFFDEVDALAASRADMKKHGGRQAINQFLMELDGVDDNNEGILILAATNAPWHLDPAFRRPGRFDRIIFVPPPDIKARAEILRILLKGKPLDNNIDYEHLARKTDKFSGADLSAVVDQTVECKLEQAMKEGIPKPITTKDLEAAIKCVRPSTAEWFATAKNYALYSNQGGAYDDILKFLKLS